MDVKSSKKYSKVHDFVALSFKYTPCICYDNNLCPLIKSNCLRPWEHCCLHGHHHIYFNPLCSTLQKQINVISFMIDSLMLWMKQQIKHSFDSCDDIGRAKHRQKKLLLVPMVENEEYWKKVLSWFLWRKFSEEIIRVIKGYFLKFRWNISLWI